MLKAKELAQRKKKRIRKADVVALGVARTNQTMLTMPRAKQQHQKGKLPL